MNDRPRILMLSHHHPALSPGGAQQSAYSLFELLKSDDRFEVAFVANASARDVGHNSPFGSFRGRADEILWSPPPIIRFRLASSEPDELSSQLEDLIHAVRPNLVHIHHYVGCGTDLIRYLRRQCGLPLVLTLHEYLAICALHGQMVKADGSLCEAAFPSQCNRCMPQFSASGFFQREQRLLTDLQLANIIIAPSEFLAHRYIDWGLDPVRIRVIENPMNLPTATRKRTRRVGKTSLGFFGQYTRFKGVEVLLSAVASIPSEERRRFTLHLYGIDPSRLDPNTTAQLVSLKAQVSDCVIDCGPYRHAEVIELMSSVDWVVVPSLWWENSPLVIQEARAAGVPVLCSDIGGMAEKVRAEIDGAHFRAGSVDDLARKIVEISSGDLVVSGELPSPESSYDLISRSYLELLQRN